jgi:hypothetical protein
MAQRRFFQAAYDEQQACFNPAFLSPFFNGFNKVFIPSYSVEENSSNASLSRSVTLL